MIDIKEKLDLIAAAGDKATLHTKDLTPPGTKGKYKVITTESISIKVGEAKPLLESFRANKRSEAIRHALEYANKHGELEYFK